MVRLGLWYAFDFLWSIPEFFRWLRNGCTGAAPRPVKMMIVRSYLKKYGLREFVETGTYLGDTLGHIAKTGAHCSSIELSENLHRAAIERFKHRSNIRLICGDSAQKLPELIRELSAPACFWLDGHYSAGFTAQSDADTPISAELAAIIAHPIKGHVILIDDAFLFNGTDDYPPLDQLLRRIREDGNYDAEVSADIIRLTPKRVR